MSENRELLSCIDRTLVEKPRLSGMLSTAIHASLEKLNVEEKKQAIDDIIRGLVAQSKKADHCFSSDLEKAARLYSGPRGKVK